MCLILTDSNCHIHLRRNTRSCFVSNYNTVLLRSWRANIDLQPVSNYHKPVAYITVCFSKPEQEMSKSVRQAEREIKTQKVKTREGMYKITNPFRNARQVSVQEVPYYLRLPELW